MTSTVLFMGRVDDPTQSENEIFPEHSANLAPSISGTVYFDADQDGVRDAGEPGVEGWPVFIDSDRDGFLSGTEQQTTTGLDGSYSMTPALFSGMVVVGLARQDFRSPVISREVTLTTGETATGIDIPNPIDARWTSRLETELDATSGDDTVLLRKNGDNVEVFLADPLTSPPTISRPRDEISSIRLRLHAGNDQVVIDYSEGSPVPIGGLHLDVGNGDNTLRTTGFAQGDIHVTGGTVHIPADPGRIELFVEQGATVHLYASTRLGPLHLIDDGKLVGPRLGPVLRASALNIGPRAFLQLNGGPLIAGAWGDRYWNEAELLRNIHNGRLRDDRSPDLVAVLNDRGDGTPRFETIAGEEVDIYSIVVAGSRSVGIIGDYDADGLVSQRDLDLVLAHWGADAASVSTTWRRALPSGAVDQEELDAVLVNWGHIIE